MLANVVGDDFNDNVKDTAKWGADVLFFTDVSLQEANGHLEFRGTGGGGIVRPWVYSSGSYTSNWEVSADVHVGSLSLQQNNDIEMFLGVAPPTGVLKDDNFTVTLNLGLDSYGLYRGYYSAMKTNGYDAGEDVWVDTDDLNGKVSITFDASTKVLSAYYNGNPLGSKVVPSSWGMTGSSTFRFALGGDLGPASDSEPFNGMSYSGTDVYADNFALTGTGIADFNKSGLAYFSAFFDNGDPQDMQGAATFYQDAVTANPQDYTSRVYAAFAKVANLINDSELNALMARFGFTYEDVGGENGWDITGDFNFSGAPPSNQAIDTLWTQCQPAIDEAYTLLNAIPASWESAEVSQSVFPVDETVYVDYPDVVSAKAMLKAMRSFLNTVRAYDMTVNYATVDWPVSLPVQAITVDGNSNDWANIPVQLAGKEGDALHSVKGCRSGNTVYLLIEKDALQPNSSAYLDGSVKVKLDGQQDQINFRCPHLSAGNEVEVWFRTGNMTDEAVGTAVLNGETLELALTVPQTAGTVTDAGLIDWVWYGWRGVDCWDGESELDFEDGNHPADSLLALFPDMLKSVRNPEALTLAKADLSNAIDLGQDAGTRIRNRTGGEMHFYEYDPAYEADYDEFMARLADVKSSMTAPTVFNIGTDNAVTVHLGAFYTAPFVTRDMLPAYRADALLNDPIQGTFPDPTFGGVFPNLTRSDFAEWITGDKNLVLQANGGVLESFTSQYDNNLYAAANLTDGAVGSGAHNWVSAVIPAPGPQTFEYSFSGGQSANLTSLTLVNATRAQINCKDFQVWISANGSNAWTKVAEGTLADNGQPQPFSLSEQIAKRARLVITSGYSTAGWELAEFELYGYFDAPLRPADVWYTAHGIERGPSETWEDVDSRIVPGKGTTLLREYIADTDPTDTNSVFRVKNVNPGPPVVIRFELASTQRAYTLQYTDDLSSGIWYNVPGTERHAGTGGEDSLSDDNVPATKRRFYRMKVEIP